MLVYLGNQFYVAENVVRIMRGNSINSRAFGCRGRSAATDVLAVIQKENRKFRHFSVVFYPIKINSESATSLAICVAFSKFYP